MKTLAISLMALCSWAQPKPSNFVAELQVHWGKIQTLQAQFEQTVTSKVIGIPDTTKGTFTVKKPDSFKWEAADSTQYIHNKKLTHVQLRAQRGRTLVDTYKDVSQRVDLDFLQILAGTLPIGDRYEAKNIRTKAGITQVDFVPKRAKGQAFVAEFDQKSYLLRALSFDSGDARTSMTFRDSKVNPKLAADTFEYKRQPEDVVQER